MGVFNKTIIPLALVGYEMIIANSALRSSLAIYHLISNASLPVVYRRPFASKAVFKRFSRILSSPFTVPNSRRTRAESIF